MKHLLTAVGCLGLFTSGVFAVHIPQCDQIDLEKLEIKFERIFACRIGEEAHYFNRDIGDKERLCIIRIAIAHNQKIQLDPVQQEIWELYDIFMKHQ